MQRIEGYQLVRRIGAGGMGTVHEALDADGNKVAVKVLHEAIAADPAARERLRREVDLLHRVRGQGVARVLDAEVDGATAFVVTELIDGPTLEDDVRANGPLAPEELTGLARGLADGLHAIHAAGVTHRDLKPGNVMLSPDGPVIIDFGIAQVADDVRLTQTGMVTGTPGYLDPDVLEGSDPGPGGDWWAWAAVVTYAATGRPPFGRGGMQAVLARVSSGAVDTAGLPESTAAVLAAALTPEPARRLPPGEVLAALAGDWDRPALHQVLAPAAAGTDRLPPPAAPTVRSDMPPPVPDHATRVMPPAPPPAWPQQPAPQPAAQPWGPVPGWPPPQEVPRWAVAPRRRTGTVAGVGLGVSAVAVLVPGWWLVGVAGLLVLLGGTGRGARRLRGTRMRRGLRRADAARAWLGSPVHLLWAAGAALPGLLLGGVVAGGAWWLTHALAEPPDEVHPWLLWAAAAFGLGLAWTVPPSGAAREGTRLALGSVPRPVRVALVLLALVTVLVIAGVVLAGDAPDPLWSPLPTPQ